MAEISCNHQGDYKQAFELIEAAKGAGADAVKIQLYTADDMTIDNGYLIEDGPWKDKNLYSLYTKTQTNYDLARCMMVHANQVDIPLFASVFSKEGIDWCEHESIPAYKIASFEIPDLELIKYASETGKPLVISTGMASSQELYVVRDQLNDSSDFIFMHCMSAYPTKLTEANLWRIRDMRRYSGYVGFSDHTRGITAGPLAVAAGAVMLEKHLMLRFTDDVPEDAQFSLYPDEFASYVRQCRQAAEACMQNECPDEASSHSFRRSIYAIKDIKAGELYTRENIRVIRPAFGMHGHNYGEILGKQALLDTKAGSPIRSWRNP